MPSNRQIADHLSLIADAVDLSSGDSTRSRTYRAAARRVERSRRDIAAIARAGKLTEVPGIGESLAVTILQFTTTATSRRLDELEKAIPEGLWQLLDIRGLGARTVGRIGRELGIGDIDGLRTAALDGQLATMPGIGQRKVAQIIAEIGRIAAASGLIPLAVAFSVAESIGPQLVGTAGVSDWRIAGDARRGVEAVAAVELVAVAPLLTDQFRALAGERRIALPIGRRGQNVRLIVHPATPVSLGSVLLAATGSQRHLDRLGAIATRVGLDISPAGDKFATEADLYRALGMQYVPPELREDGGEIESAQTGRLPELIEPDDLTCDLHAHSDWSDGQGSVAEMAAAAGAAGLATLAITDHSQSLAVAGGLTAEELASQREEIDAFRALGDQLNLRQGTESEILVDGSLDFEDAALSELDWVNASVHVAMDQDRDAMTARLLSAIANPYLGVLGHPTGRILLGRPGFEYDFDTVFAAAAAAGVALEINSQPKRMDLSSDLARRAAAAGAMLSINSDAHAPSQLEVTRFGVISARRAGLSKSQVINCLPWPELADAAQRRRRSGPAAE